MSGILAAAISAIAACLHWMRFNVPITIAAGAADTVGLFVSVILSVSAKTNGCWDVSDTNSTARRSVVALWYLLSYMGATYCQLLPSLLYFMCCVFG
jgi:hypothetical protein